MHELHGEDRAGRSDRVAERDRAARDVERLRVEPDIARDGDRLCRERLVQLDEVDVRELKPRALERLRDRERRARSP